METNSSPFDARADMVCYPLSKLKGFLNVDSTTIEMHFEPLLVVADSDDTSVIEDKVALTLVTADTHKDAVSDIIKAIKYGTTTVASNDATVDVVTATEKDMIVIADDNNSLYATSKINACTITVTNEG